MHIIFLALIASINDLILAWFLKLFQFALWLIISNVIASG